MRKELRKQIELLEQKMKRSPNNINNGGSHFLYRRERMIRFKMLQKNMPQKMLAKRLNLTESYISKLITGERYNKDFERYIIHILDVNYCCIKICIITTPANILYHTSYKPFICNIFPFNTFR